MSLRPESLLPDAGFRHIGLLVFFMSFLAGASLFGLGMLQTVTGAWTADIRDAMIIEIPAYDAEAGTFVPGPEIESVTQGVLGFLSGRETVRAIEPYRPDIPADQERLFADIPKPVFIRAILDPARNDDAAAALANALRTAFPSVLVRTPETWMAEIREIAATLSLVFWSLLGALGIVTAFSVAEGVRSKLQSGRETIALLHLMGATKRQIGYLFNRLVIAGVIKGALPALVLVALMAGPSARMLGYQSAGTVFYGTLPFAGLGLLLIALAACQYTVRRTLEDMP